MKSYSSKLKIMFILVLFFGIFFFATNSEAATSFYVIPADDPTCLVNGDGTTNHCAQGAGQPGYWRGFSNIQWGSGVSQLGGNKTLYLIGGKIYRENLVFPEICSGQDAAHPLTVTVFGSGAAVLDMDFTADKSGIVIEYGVLHDIVIDGVRGNAVNGDYDYGLKIINIAEDPDHQCCYDVRQNTAGNKNIKVLHLDISSSVHTCREATNDPGNYGWHENPLAAIRMIDTSLGENTGLEIAYNWIHGTDCTDRGTYWITSGIRAGWGGATSGYTNTLIHHNRIECIGADGITGANYASIYNNVIKNIGTNVGQCGAGSVHPDALEGGGASHLLFYNNYFDVSGQSIYLPRDFSGTSSDIWIFNNVSIAKGGKALSIGGNGGTNTDIKVFNNTFADSSTPAGFNADHPPTGLNIQNNIFGNVYDQILVGLYNFESQIVGMDYNAYTDESSSYPRIISTDGSIYTLNEWQGLGREPHSRIARPIFNSDYSLRSANISLIAGGNNLSQYCSLLPPLCFDKNGIARPQGSAWDIGAYEYVEGGDTTPPAAPSGLAVK